MKLPSSYVLDREVIRLNCYRLICLFYANKQIAWQNDPEHEFPDALAVLERDFFAREMTHLLLAIAISIRAIEDQIMSLPAEDSARRTYLKAKARIDKLYSCMMFDEMTLREVCNKIIHATTVEPHFIEASDPHQYDEVMWHAWQEAHPDGNAGARPEGIAWKHLSGNIRLGGKKDKVQWWHLLEVPLFVEAVCELLSGES